LVRHLHALHAALHLRGGVALADALAELEAPFRSEERAEPAKLRVRLLDELSALEARLDDALEHAFKPRYRLPTPARAFTLLEQAGLFGQARARALTAATRTLWAPFDDFFETHLKRARFGLRDLRAELGRYAAGSREPASGAGRVEHEGPLPRLGHQTDRDGRAHRVTRGRADAGAARGCCR
jgi:hypothetical protein